MPEMIKAQAQRETMLAAEALYLKEIYAAWSAKPWYERARIRARTKVRGWRFRLGEIIAGQSFDP